MLIIHAQTDYLFIYGHISYDFFFFMHMMDVQITTTATFQQFYQQESSMKCGFQSMVVRSATIHNMCYTVDTPFLCPLSQSHQTE